MKKNTSLLLLAAVFVLLPLLMGGGCKTGQSTTEYQLSPALKSQLSGLKRLEVDREESMEIGDDIPIYDPSGKKLSGKEMIQKLGTGKFMVEEYGKKGILKAIVLRPATKEEMGHTTVIEGLPPEKEEIDMSKVGFAPAFSAKDMDGNDVSIESLKGKIVVMNFWFTACQPCLEEIPQLNQLAQNYEDKGVEFIAITHDNKDKVAKFLQKTPFEYRHITDGKDIVRNYFISGFPTNLVIDKNGKIAYQSLGYMSQVELALAKQIDKLLE